MIEELEIMKEKIVTQERENFHKIREKDQQIIR